MVLSLLLAFPTSAHAREEKDLHALETAFRENALKAEQKYKGKPITFDTFVVAVDKDKATGNPHIKAYIVYNNDGVEAISEIYLKPNQLETAMKLKPNDHIKVTGILKSREIYTKESIEIHGYNSSVFNGNGGGGSVNGGTVTRSWPAYTFYSSYVSIIETEEARVKRVADAAANKENLSKQFVDALIKGDFIAAQKIIDAGLDPAVINELLEAIVNADPDNKNYDRMIPSFKFLVSTKKVNIVTTLGKCMGYETFPNPRPKLFKVFVDLKMVNFNNKFPNGDNLLLFLIKEKLSLISGDKAPKALELTFSDTDYEMVKVIAESGQAKGIADLKDVYGKSAKDYFNTDSRIKYSNDSETTPYNKIKELILKMD